MKPSDSKERTRERKRKERMSRPTGSGNVTPLPFTPKVQELSRPDVMPLPQRTKGKTPEESGYPKGQVEVRIGPQGQQDWRLRGHYDMPSRILCFKA